MEKLNIDLPIIVEGKYDKIKISSVAEACIIQTDGFGVFKNSERLALIRSLAKKSRIIVMTDSDGAGKLIRSHITSAIPADRLIQLYVPQVKGKERRKSEASAEGYLGVEGTDVDVIRKLLEPYAVGAESLTRGGVTKTDLFVAGLSGGNESASKRDELATSLGLPRKMTANALLSAINVLMSREEFLELTKHE
jgi:ribonuclease M5